MQIHDGRRKSPLLTHTEKYLERIPPMLDSAHPRGVRRPRNGAHSDRSDQKTHPKGK